MQVQQLQLADEIKAVAPLIAENVALPPQLEVPAVHLGFSQYRRAAEIYCTAFHSAACLVSDRVFHALNVDPT